MLRPRTNSIEDCSALKPVWQRSVVTRMQGQHVWKDHQPDQESGKSRPVTELQQLTTEVATANFADFNAAFACNGCKSDNSRSFCTLVILLSTGYT